MSEVSPQHKLLLVDDVPANLDILLQLLEPQGYFVMVATSGERALKIAAQGLPDLILLDIMMPPGIDGYEVCRRLKADEVTRDIPILFLSALDDTEVKVKAFQVGGVDYISKPFRAEEVLARVNIHLQLRSIRKDLEDRNTRLSQEIENRKRTETALAAANRQLEQLAVQDGLTRIANRRRLDEYLPTCWLNAAREHLPLALILCDIDCFKLYNDHYGHQAGDNCLRAVAQAIEGALRRPLDLVGRYGGEEFLIILPGTDLDGAAHIAEEIVSSVVGLRLAHKFSTVFPTVTLSLGVSAATPGHLSAKGSQEEWGQLLASADQALYQAKNAGRNRMVLASPLLAEKPPV